MYEKHGFLMAFALVTSCGFISIAGSGVNPIVTALVLVVSVFAYYCLAVELDK